MIVTQGDIVRVDFNPTRGHEPRKRRPALVVSTDAFNLRSSLTMVCPITSTDNGYPLHVPLRHEDLHGFICVEQLRSLDLSARQAEIIGKAGLETMNEVLNVLAPVFGL